MAEDIAKQVTAGTGTESRTLRIAVMGSCLTLWILAPFMVISANGIRAEMRSLQNAVAANASRTDGASLESYQLADQDGQVVYSFKRVAQAAGGMGCGGAGGPMEGCSMMKGAQAAAGSGMEGCSMMKGTR